MKYARTSSLFFNTPLALLPSKAEEIRAFWETKLAGADLDFEERQEPFAATLLEANDWFSPELAAANGNAGGPGGGQIAVLPLHGVMSQRLNLMSALSGGTSTQMFAAALREQVRNPQVKAVIIDTDSPGGNVYGVDELASEIFSLREQKSIIAVANSAMFSAAYYTMSNASEIVITPGGELGSIGVIAMHVDQSEYNAKEGVKPTIITFGKYKAEGNSHEPLGDEARAEIQSQVDRYGSMFLRAVARGREVGVDTVRNSYGQGRIFGAQDAVRLGMADRVATLDETITRFASGGRVSRRNSAELEESARLMFQEPPVPVAETDERERDLLTVDRARYR